MPALLPCPQTATRKSLFMGIAEDELGTDFALSLRYTADGNSEYVTHTAKEWTQLVDST
jgi:hypothetical protein